MTCGAGLAAGADLRTRQVRQQKRIAQGARSGELTRPETRRLERNAKRIHRSIVRDRVDGGVFTPAERAAAQRKLNRQSRAIRTQKHDAQWR
jgi:hypothetical protein